MANVRRRTFPMEDLPMIDTVDIDLHGKTITLETGRVAKQANGAVVVKTGDNVVLVTACSAEEPKATASFFRWQQRVPAVRRYPGCPSHRPCRRVQNPYRHQLPGDEPTDLGSGK